MEAGEKMDAAKTEWYFVHDKTTTHDRTTIKTVYEKITTHDKKYHQDKHHCSAIMSSKNDWSLVHDKTTKTHDKI